MKDHVGSVRQAKMLSAAREPRRGDRPLDEGIDCPKCRTQMVTGWIPDTTYGGFVSAGWYPGDPVKSWWGTYKVDRKQLIPIQTFRCSNCGYVESYAKGARTLFRS